jgi:succinyl-diaminopimelate desuccinylase
MCEQTMSDVELDLDEDVVALTAALVDVPSESHHEAPLADAVEAALGGRAWLDVERDGNTVIARTHLGRVERVVFGGHLDTVPAAGNLPSRLADGILYGLGSCDMKGGVAVMLRLAATVPEPVRDVTYFFYEAEEVEAEHNGLRRLAENRPELLEGDLAVLMEPTGADIEGGCQGTLRVDIRVPGRRAHSARAWMGVNAIHDAAPVLERLRAYVPREPDVDGLTYREGLQAVGIRGGVAGNVVPDECVVTVNHRFAPDRSADEAIAHVRAVFDGFEVTVVDAIGGARPGLDLAAAQAFVTAVGGTPRAKYGWTDVARFAALGLPAVNYGPGDPMLAHTPQEHVAVDQLRQCEDRLRTWLTS